MRTVITLAVGFWLARTLYQQHHPDQERWQRQLRRSLAREGWSEKRIRDFMETLTP